MKDPTNEGARVNLVQSANSLVGYLKYVDKVNSITKKLAKLNQEILITYAQTYARGQDYKNILDERDRLLRELSEYINIRVQEDDIGRVKVETSKGFVLVEDKFSWELAYDGANKRILWKSKDGSQVDISGEISGGRIRGGLDAIADLQDYQNRLDQLAKKLISKVAGNISTQLSNLDYSKADEFNKFSRLWWDNSKNIYQGLTNAIAGNLNSYKKQYDIENAILSSLNAKLQEMQGVSIDKEFMEVFQLQKSYQALAKVVSAMDELIQTTLNMV
jgi:flagellar hook-associated protein 1 FlgK